MVWLLNRITGIKQLRLYVEMSPNVLSQRLIESAASAPVAENVGFIMLEELGIYRDFFQSQFNKPKEDPFQDIWVNLHALVEGRSVSGR